MISSTQKSSGKTMVSMGILSHFATQGLSIRSFKKGPDFIDPMWHRLASGTECYNLDPYLMGSDACIATFLRESCSDNRSLSLVEGNHGLHDGIDLDGSDSSAGLAVILKTPILLVVDSRQMNRGIAALVMGMQAMPPKVNIAGIILNQVRSSRQEEKQKSAIERFCKVPVVGAIPVDKELVIPERHLGLTTVDETADAAQFIRNAGEKIAHYCDMKSIRSLFYEAVPLQLKSIEKRESTIKKRVKIGVFRDAAFSFYYPDNLNALRECGAELLFIDSLHDSSLPEVDGLYLGGGFPELFFELLSANRGLLKDVHESVESGLPAYAECGGLIYLCRSASYGGKKYSLAGLLPLDIGFQHHPAGHGYLDLRSRTDSPWFRKGVRVRAHEFHYSKPVILGGDTLYQFDVIRGNGITGKSDGLLCRNLFASYGHLHAAGNPEWAERFVSLAYEMKAKIKGSAV
ncbi:MAG: hydrogenobyrinic acid a,c-diamide synthase (glutamine-hydrolyzing) [Chlorobiaceae bacterium]|nr:hydrogenobyrinic acid a,c-diamide synthase (glutamine-hydrolyzing) [Chlorobiaceae bacterium]